MEEMKVQTYDEAVTEIGRLGAFAPGSYVSTCVDCDKQFVGDKLAMNCLPCAVLMLKQKAENPRPVPQPGLADELDGVISDIQAHPFQGSEVCMRTLGAVAREMRDPLRRQEPPLVVFWESPDLGWLIRRTAGPNLELLMGRDFRLGVEGFEEVVDSAPPGDVNIPDSLERVLWDRYGEFEEPTRDSLVRALAEEQSPDCRTLARVTDLPLRAWTVTHNGRGHFSVLDEARCESACVSTLDEALRRIPDDLLTVDVVNRAWESLCAGAARAPFTRVRRGPACA